MQVPVRETVAQEVTSAQMVETAEVATESHRGAQVARAEAGTVRARAALEGGGEAALVMGDMAGALKVGLMAVERGVERGAEVKALPAAPPPWLRSG